VSGGKDQEQKGVKGDEEIAGRTEVSISGVFND
jgi:hypothetical protein